MVFKSNIVLFFQGDDETSAMLGAFVDAGPDSD